MAQSTSTVSLFVPLLVLVVVEISQASREFDLTKIARRKQEPFFYSVFYLLDRSSQELIRIPQLGPFNFIHGTNLGILILGYSLTITTSTGTTRILTTMIIYLFWVLFPMIEVNEYVAIMDDPEIRPTSFLYHSILTTVAAGFIFAYIAIINDPADMILDQFNLAGFIFIVVIIYYTGLVGFLRLLEKELETCQGDLSLIES